LASTQSTLSNKPILRVYEDSKNRIWVGTDNKGLQLYQAETETFYAYQKDPSETGALKSNAIWEIFEDRVGRLYVGSNNQGMFIHDPYAKWFNHKDGRYGLRLKFSTVTSFLEHGNQIWIGTDGGGISVWDRSTNQYSFVLHDSTDTRSIGSNEVLSLYKDSYGIIWSGNWKGGLNRYDPQTATFKRYCSHDAPNSLGSDNVFAIKEASNGDLWISTWDHGISRYNRATDDFFNIGYIPYNDTLLSHKLTYDLEIDDLTGDIWVATVLGLDRVRMLDDKRFKIKHYRLDEKDSLSLSAHNVHCLYEDKQNRLWVGTSEGLNLFDRNTEQFRRFYIRDGLSGNVIKEIIGDENGNLWVTTNEGITKMSETESGFSFEQYFKSDGLQSDEFFFNSGLKTTSGELFLGGINGFNHFNPSDFVPINHPPQLELTGFQLFYREVEINGVQSPLTADIGSLDQLTLNREQSVFSISYRGLSITDPDKLQYAYKLDGFDKQWNYVGKRTLATYTNLDPGQYTFLVRATNRDGVWMNKARELSITILPAWWQHWWAGFVFFIIPIGFFLILVQIRFAIIKAQKRQLAMRVAAQTESLRQQKEEIERQAEQLSLANQQKTKLFSIISHDLRSPIYSLKGIVKLLDVGILKAEDLYRIKGDINRKIDNIGQVMENLLDWSVSQLEGEKVSRSDFDLREISQEITQLYEPLATEKEIQLANRIHESTMVYADPNQLRVILRNLLGNALKFTPANGTVSLRTDFYTPDLVHISVSDTGQGICPTQIKHLFSFADKQSTRGTAGEKGVGLGLILVREYVEKNGGEIEVESEPGVGTTFRFSLPLAPQPSLA
ncbi:MAG: two-component regulator propeller domain-containing protein, partial [Bacteroidota bacterium]